MTPEGAKSSHDKSLGAYISPEIHWAQSSESQVHAHITTRESESVLKLTRKKICYE